MIPAGLLWDLFQQYRLGQLDKKLDRVQTGAADGSATRREVLRLESKIDRLALITRAMSELLEAQGVTAEQLTAKVVEIDLRDGQADGRAAPVPKRCPKCDAMMSPQFGRCLFCGYSDGALPAI